MQQDRRRWILGGCTVALFGALEKPGLDSAWAAPAATTAITVPWRLLRTLDLNTGNVPPELKKIDSVKIRVAGYMVPLDDDDDSSDEFLIVPIAGGCIHTPPPPPNQIVQCKMTTGKKIKIAMWDAQWFEGTLKIAQVQSPYGPASFQLKVTLVEPYKPQ